MYHIYKALNKQKTGFQTFNYVHDEKVSILSTYVEKKLFDMQFPT